MKYPPDKKPDRFTQPQIPIPPEGHSDQLTGTGEIILEYWRNYF